MSKKIRGFIAGRRIRYERYAMMSWKKIDAEAGAFIFNRDEDGIVGRICRAARLSRNKDWATGVGE